MLVDPWLLRAAAVEPDRAAVVTAQRSVTYRELSELAATAAAALAERGVGPQSRVGIALEPGLDFAIVLHACLLLGAVALPIDLRLSSAELGERRQGCSMVVSDPLPAPRDAAPATPTRAQDLDAVATVIHTSGTSDRPKAVELTGANWLWSALGSAVALGLDPEERWLCALPLAHVGGLSILVRSAIYATTAVVHERFEVDAVMDELMRPGGATIVSLVATTLVRLLDAGLRDPPRLRCALVGGGPVAPALLARARAAGVPVNQTYGLTEACSQVTTVPAAGQVDRAGAVAAGPPLFCTRVRIADDGEILVAGPTVASGALGADGWLHTGDIGELDELGALSVTGRKADTIVTGGENVAPTEVEAVLLAHPAVAEAAVHGRPDAEWGEALVAAIVPRAAVDPAALRAHCAARLASFKVPKRFELVRSLPRTRSGKLLRRELS